MLEIDFDWFHSSKTVEHRIHISDSMIVHRKVEFDFYLQSLRDFLERDRACHSAYYFFCRGKYETFAWRAL